jgi:hypothetical protein
VQHAAFLHLLSDSSTTARHYIISPLARTVLNTNTHLCTCILVCAATLDVLGEALHILGQLGVSAVLLGLVYGWTLGGTNGVARAKASMWALAAVQVLFVVLGR